MINSNYAPSPDATEKREAKDIVESLWQKLPEIAKDLIGRSQDVSIERNKLFLENPDSVSEHEPSWHQWGIITHTKMFEKIYREQVPEFLAEWGIKDKVDEQMSQEIDGMSKAELLNIAAPLHDLGKFTMRTLKPEEDGSMSASFKKHEADSGRIIRTPEFTQMMKLEYGLTDAQIEYIARCAELHFELGIVRNEAKKSEAGYTLAYANSDEYKQRAKQIMAEYADFQPEIGILFLADSFGKTEMQISAKTDEEIEDQTDAIKDALAEQHLSPKLSKAIKQVPVNKAVAATYLKTWAETT